MFDWLWPTICVVCREADPGVICPDCAPGTLLRPPCPLGVRRTFALERYERPVGRRLRQAKLDGDLITLQRLARLFARWLAPDLSGSGIAAIVPAPSRWRTRFARGFAAASVLAHEVGRELQVPVVHALVNRAPTKLARLDRAQRRRVLAGAIRATRDVAGHVLLVDDILTTGTTAEGCALELIGGTTAQVSLATLCVTAADPR